MTSSGLAATAATPADVRATAAHALRMRVARRVVEDRMFGRCAPVRFGQFDVRELVGAGAMGEVYRARDVVLGRDVALKVVRPAAYPEQSDDAWVMREARSLARLSHRNVVAVHQVQQVEGLVVIAMEYVAGPTMAAWLDERPRRWREVVPLFVQVARGLAAVHRAGLVHRDVKPSNIIVGDDGVVRLSDFGLARPTASEPPDAAAVDAGSPRLSVGRGTPAYMAPELHAGQPATVFSDQYAFCASLWQALYRALPENPGASADAPGKDRARLVRTGAPERAGGVPGWLRAAAERGLRARPDDRYSSMDELLADLGRDRPRGWRRLAVAAALVAAVAAAYAMGREEDSGGALCARAGDEIAASWNEPVAAAIERQLVDSGRDHGRDTASRVRKGLTEFAAEWRAERKRACEATHVHGATSAALLDARMLCLDRRRDAFDAAVALLAEPASEARADRAVALVDGLPGLADCRGREVLDPAFALPEGPAARAELRSAEGQLERARALVRRGEFAEALALAEQVAQVGARHGYAPLLAASDYARALAMSRTGTLRGAEQALYSAARYAGESGDDLGVARAWIELTYAIGRTVDREAAADVAMQAAQTALARAGAPTDLEADLANYRGVLAWTRRDSEGAGRHWQRALELRERAGAGPSVIASALNNLSAAQGSLGRHDEAQANLSRALELKLDHLGPLHPSTARTMSNIGAAIVDRHLRGGPGTVSHEQLELAAERCRRAFEVQQGALGPDNPVLAYPLTCLGTALIGIGRPDDAVAHLERSLALREAHPDEDPLELAYTRLSLAQALGGGDRAIELALAAADAFGGASDPGSQRDLARAREWLDAHGRANSINAPRSAVAPRD